MTAKIYFRQKFYVFQIMDYLKLLEEITLPI